MKEDNCIFCKIAAGEIPSMTIYEDENFRVIFDIAPASRGHAIILPKNHAANIYELSEEDCSKVFVVAAKVARAMKKVLNCDGMNVLQNNGEIAGQTVFHFHVHLIPRYKDDTVTITWKQGEADMEELEQIADKIKEEL
ncbi:HIT family protein [Anaerolentibacter hominis]|uniref:HIT family protein n=1 Tax=Anaerolentibacter hominis TaxID=3079009 RepID=UPI0031B86D21